jgi:zinc transporter 11
MLRDVHPVLQALLGTLFTWGVTALGAGLVFVLHGEHRKFLDTSLGFAAGVMMAASFWSLLTPAIDRAAESGYYGEFNFIPVTIGFLLGALFCYGTDLMVSRLGTNPTQALIMDNVGTPKNYNTNGGHSNATGPVMTSIEQERAAEERQQRDEAMKRLIKWKRIMLLVIAVTVHNIPEGLAVGVGFGAIPSSNNTEDAYMSARNLALGIGIQNFPEGLVVSLPLHAAGYSIGKSFFWGQLSGMVEPIFGVLGALAVTFFSVILPYALAFAAAAMIYVVADDILPESHASGNGLQSTWGVISGFIVMMFLETGGDRIIQKIFID